MSSIPATPGCLRHCPFIALSESFGTLYSFSKPKLPLRWVPSCFFGQPPRPLGTQRSGHVFWACAIKHITLQPKASIVPALPKVREDRILQPLWFKVVLEGFSSELDKNGIGYNIFFFFLQKEFYTWKARAAQFSNVRNDKIIQFWLLSVRRDRKQ